MKIISDYSDKGVEKTVLVREVILKAIAKVYSWVQAAEILGYSPRHMSRIKKRYEEYGFDGLFDRRTKTGPRIIKMEDLEKILTLYRDKYKGFNVAHYRDMLKEEENIEISYTHLYKTLSEAGLIMKTRKKIHRKKRERKPEIGMMLLMDTSDHIWFSDYESHLIAIMDDATGEIYKANIFDSDSTLNNMSVIKSVVEEKGVFGSLYVDRASMFKTTRRGGVHVNIKEEQEDTQIQRALKSLNIMMINANSPQAKGRIERLFKTFQDRLVKELKLKKIKTMEEANTYIEKIFLPHYNDKFKKEPLSPDSFFLKTTADLDTILCVKEERTVDNANCVRWNGKVLQIERQDFRYSFAKCKVIVNTHIDGRISISYGYKTIGVYDETGKHINPLPLKHKIKRQQSKAQGLATISV